MKRFDVLTIFPKIFSSGGDASYLNHGILKRAQEKGLISVAAHNLRDFSSDKKHKKVDDTPYGGGPGMVLKVEPIYRAVKAIKGNPSVSSGRRKRRKTRVILFSTRGKKLDGKVARRLAKYDQFILICGRYEGVDERVAEKIADEELSIGDYVLSGGELPALVFIETVARFLPGVLGKYESLEDIKGSYPVYTKPEVFKPTGNRKQVVSGKAWRVPKVLLSGDHKKIEEWRKKAGLYSGF